MICCVIETTVPGKYLAGQRNSDFHWSIRVKYTAGFFWCLEPIRAYLKASSLLYVGEIGCKLRVPRLQTHYHYSMVIIIIILIGLIFILKPLIWWGVVGVCQYVNQQHCRTKTALTGGSS